jgi:hypothetical protein
LPHKPQLPRAEITALPALKSSQIMPAKTLSSHRIQAPGKIPDASKKKTKTKVKKKGKRGKSKSKIVHRPNLPSHFGPERTALIQNRLKHYREIVERKCLQGKLNMPVVRCPIVPHDTHTRPASKRGTLSMTTTVDVDLPAAQVLLPLQCQFNLDI